MKNIFISYDQCQATNSYKNLYWHLFIVSLLHWNLTLSMMPPLSSLATAAVIISCLNKDVHIIIALELETWHYTNTVMICSTRGYHNNNLQSPQWWQQFNGSVQERRNSSALAMELRLSWMNQPSWHHHLGRNLDMCWPAYIIIMITDVSAPNIYQAISNQHADLVVATMSSCSWQVHILTVISPYAGISLGMCPANERCCYNTTTSLIGWAHT